MKRLVMQFVALCVFGGLEIGVQIGPTSARKSDPPGL